MEELVFFVYILKCSDGSYYTGHTDNMEQRLAQHIIGSTDGYTSKRRPVKLVFVETVSSRQEALDAEFQIKKWTRKKKEALIDRDWELLHQLARRRKNQKIKFYPSYGSLRLARCARSG